MPLASYAAPAAPRLCSSPHWTLFKQGALLVLSGGGDEVYVVDEAVGDNTSERVLAAYQAGNLGDLLDDPECGAAVRQLRRMGAIVPTDAVLRGPKFSLRWLGTQQPALLDALRAVPETGLPSPHYVDADAQAEPADLLLIVRTTATWQEALASYSAAPPSLPHLLIDTSHHRTLSIGPFVVPGQTACVACLGNRVAHRWGDPPLPELPLAATRYALIAALILQAIANAQVPQDAQSGEAVPAASATMLLPFLEHALSLNLDTLGTRRDRVFQLPGCPACRVLAAPGAGAGQLALPWATHTL